MSNYIYSGAMTQIDHWANENYRCSFLKEQLKRGSLSLILGAGVSIAFELPNWNKLIANMEYLMKLKCPAELDDNMKKAGWLKMKCKDNTEYIKFVRSALYKDTKAFDMKSMKENKTLNAITALSANSIRGYVRNILTFNFDDILETYLRSQGRIVTTYTEGNKYNENSDVNIYHIHGYLPNPNSDEKCSSNIIFDKESYDDIKDYKSWDWYPKVANLLRTNTCIFIGLSGNDENMERFLKDTKMKHANIKNKDLFWGVAFLKDPTAEILEKWENWGIYPIQIPNFDCIQEQLYHIVQ